MKSWQEQCADIVELLEDTFREVQYKLSFRRLKNEWVFQCEQVRNDGGPHTGAAFFWLQVKSENVDELPKLLLEKAKAEIAKWQAEGLDKVKERLAELTKARDELNKRLGVNLDLSKLEEAIKG